ncbi:uncharacterized protein ARMOST_01754 [Armillaria ostoyae]|uniref:Uncharacterized protein n=1 Tax=Armillaria ostoyae TaxID=47428 RepID=A0A284QPS6_ARMOS|nr:uncharacterized protein ARMOST_01754 [Armillaria ostoyae]
MISSWCSDWKNKRTPSKEPLPFRNPRPLTLPISKPAQGNSRHYSEFVLPVLANGHTRADVKSIVIVDDQMIPWYTDNGPPVTR